MWRSQGKVAAMRFGNLVRSGLCGSVLRFILSFPLGLGGGHKVRIKKEAVSPPNHIWIAKPTSQL